MHKRTFSSPSIGSRLKAWRKHLGLTQEDYSQATGMHIGVLRKYENDVNIPGGDALVSIGKTGVNLHWLLMGEGEMEAAGNGDDPSVPPQTLLHSRLKEAQRLLEVLDEERQLTVLDDIFMRVKEAKRVTDLERVVRELSRKLG